MQVLSVRDRAVLGAYELSPQASEEAVLAELLARYEALTTGA